MQTNSSQTQLSTLIHRQHAPAMERRGKDTLEARRTEIASYLHDCLDFYDSNAHSPLRWDAVALGHQTLTRYLHSEQMYTLIEMKNERRAQHENPKDPSVYPTFDDVRNAVKADQVLNSEEAARLLTIASWAAESEPEDIGPVTYAMVTGARAERQQDLDWPSTRELRWAQVPSVTFAGRVAQCRRWMHNIEKRFPASSIRTTPSPHGRWAAEEAHELCARAYFSCLKASASTEEYVAELRRYRSGPFISTAALACDKLKDVMTGPFEDLDESQPVPPEILGLSSAEPGTPEAIYLSLWNEARAARVRTQLGKGWRKTATAEDIERHDREQIFSQIELTARATDQLKGHRLFWSAVAWGYAIASRFAISATAREEHKDHPFLKSAAFQQILQLADEAMQAQGLNPGIFCSIAGNQMHLQQARIRLLMEGPNANDEKAKRAIFADARRLQDGIIQRWPTLFDFPETGDQFDWYADKCIRITTSAYLHVLEQAGALELRMSEAERIAKWPHPWAADSAQRCMRFSSSSG